MSKTISDLLSRLVADPARAARPFSTELSDASQRIFAAGVDVEAIAGVLREWLQKHQPCLFGRIAARDRLISYCCLTEQDLLQDDARIREKIQRARTLWLRDGFIGKKSAFVLHVASPKIASALPDETLRVLAQRLCALYLLKEEIEVDHVYHDEICLELPDDERSTWQWLAGVNYFCANGDGRWWQDHRIPGGLAFSVNSVGHLAKTGSVARAVTEEAPLPAGLPADAYLATKIDSLPKAVEMALRTISLASNAASGKATALQPLSDDDLPRPHCPSKLPDFLADKDFRCYTSFYHTDVTIPSEYFLSDIRRPAHCKARTMELTYLFDSNVDNPDYLTMGVGRRIRGASRRQVSIRPATMLIESNERLVRALREHGR